MLRRCSLRIVLVSADRAKFVLDGCVSWRNSPSIVTTRRLSTCCRSTAFALDLHFWWRFYFQVPPKPLGIQGLPFFRRRCLCFDVNFRLSPSTTMTEFDSHRLGPFQLHSPQLVALPRGVCQREQEERAFSFSPWPLKITQSITQIR